MAFVGQKIDFNLKKKFPPAKTEYGIQKVDNTFMMKVAIEEVDRWEMKSLAYKQGLSLQDLIGQLCREYVAKANALSDVIELP